jgi:hypothetical protein
VIRGGGHRSAPLRPELFTLLDFRRNGLANGRAGGGMGNLVIWSFDHLVIDLAID